MCYYFDYKCIFKMNLNIETIVFLYYYNCGGKKIREYPGHDSFDGFLFNKCRN